MISRPAVAISDDEQQQRRDDDAGDARPAQGRDVRLANQALRRFADLVRVVAQVRGATSRRSRCAAAGGARRGGDRLSNRCSRSGTLSQTWRPRLIRAGPVIGFEAKRDAPASSQDRRPYMHGSMTARLPSHRNLRRCRCLPGQAGDLPGRGAAPGQGFGRGEQLHQRAARPPGRARPRRLGLRRRR